MPNQQPLYDHPRTIVGVWTLQDAPNRRERQYAIWSSGEVITRVAKADSSNHRAVTNWALRRQLHFSWQLLVRLDRFFREHGYTRDYVTTKSAIMTLLEMHKS